MENPFQDTFKSDQTDQKLITQAVNGSRSELETLISRHQTWLFNLVLRMVGNVHDAEDVTQEIIIKVLSKLSAFRAESSFRTWLYRIAANHVITMKYRSREDISFDQHRRLIESMPDQDLSGSRSYPVEAQCLIEETKINCMMGLVLCLDPYQRLAFILAVFGANSAMGGVIMEISPESYRQQLSRARKQLNNFMNEKCGLMKAENPCRCAKKTKAAIKAGYVDPHSLQFNESYVQQIGSLVTRQTYCVDNALELRSQFLYRRQPFFQSPDYVQVLRSMLQREGMQQWLNFS
ncbi:MAG: polymerase, sigma-24 subunit, subfamily [Firmicutes bacterium]|nr:polymerase, sigma-24 subunit, subfamily [Bacillota bacterium]